MTNESEQLLDDIFDSSEVDALAPDDQANVEQEDQQTEDVQDQPAEQQDTETAADAMENMEGEQAPVIPEIDWSNLKPDIIPQAIASRTPAFQGVTSELARERQRRREIEQRYQELLHNQATGRRQDEDADTDDDDGDEFLTRKEAEKQWQQRFEQYQRQQQEAQREAYVTSDFEQARNGMQGVPANLHFDAVVNEQNIHRISQMGYGPVAQAILNNSRTPAQDLYVQIIRTIPELSQIYTTYAQQQAAQRQPAAAQTQTATNRRQPAAEQAGSKTPGDLIDADDPLDAILPIDLG